MSKFNKEKDNYTENNPKDSQSDLVEFNEFNLFYINYEQNENSFKELPFFNGESKEEENGINEKSLIPIFHDLNVNDISSNEEEHDEEDNEEIKTIHNYLEKALEDKVKLKAEISEITMVKERKINLSDSKELNETKKDLETELNDKEETKRKNISKSGKNKLKESSKIFFIHKYSYKKLIGKKRKSEHNEDDLDAIDKDKLY